MRKKVIEKKRAPIARKRKSVEKPFADGQMSNAAFFGMIRATLRNKSRFWPPVKICRDRVRESYVGLNKKRKWVYKCEMCHKVFDAKSIFVHHKIECGSLSSFNDLPGFTKRLFCNSEDLIAICDDCHKLIHLKEENNDKT